jgi:hypothetical protein
MRSAQELTHLVAEMHSTITYLPSPLNKEHQANARYAPFPYRIVAGSFALIAKISKMFTAHQTEFNQVLAHSHPSGTQWGVWRQTRNMG